MRKTIKRTVAILLVLVTVLSMVSTAFAAGENTAGSNNDVQVSGNGTLGTMLAENIADELDTGANNISDLVVDGSTATVTFQTVTAAEIVVAIYDEADTTMLASGKIEVNEEGTEADVIIEGTIPDYFIARAFMLDIESHEALCKEYTTQLYTRQMQELLKMTTDDFDNELVINLDEDKTTNFGVFKEDTIQTNASGTANQITDNGNGTYTIKNANETFKNLKSGDTFAYTYPDGSLLLVKVKSVKVSGNTVTVTEDNDVDLTDFFDYMKIDTDSSETELEIDESTLGDGVSLVKSGKNSLHTISAYGNSYNEIANSNKPNAWWDWSVEGETSREHSIEFSVDKNIINDKHTEVKLTGGIKFSYLASIKYYLSLSHQYISSVIDKSAEFSLKITGEVHGDIPLAVIPFTLLKVVNITITPSVHFEFTGEAGFTAGIKWTSGAAFDSDSGIQNLSGGPSGEAKYEVEGKLFIGLQVSVEVNIINNNVCKLELSAQGGLEVSGTTTYSTSDDEHHDCLACIAGEVYGRVTVSVKFSILKDFKIFKLKMNGFEIEATIVELKMKMLDYYYSISHKQFGFGTCPYRSYKVTISVLDSNSNPVPNVTIEGTGLSKAPTTDPDGKATFYLPRGEYTLTVTKDNMTGTAVIHIIGEPKEVTIKISTAGTSQPGITQPANPVVAVIDSGTCGDNATWTLTDNGVLMIEGTGSLYDWDYWNGYYAPWYDNRNIITIISVSNSITSIGNYSFQHCESLTNVIIGNSVTSIGCMAFYSCTSLTSMTIPDSVTTIGNYAFDECISLVNVTIGKSVTTVGENAFTNCHSLVNMTIPDNVITIDDYAFAYCISLTSVMIPDSVTTIGDHAFYNCDSLKDVYYGGSQEKWNKISIGNDNYSLLNATIHFNSTSPANTPTANTPRTLHTGTVTAKSGTTTAAYTNLNPNSQYVLIVVKDPNATDLLAPSNLLYIAQHEADSSGNVTFTYKTRTGERGTELMYGAERTSQAGDIDANGSIDNADLVTLARHIVGLRDFTTVETLAADMNGDKTIDNSDLVSLARMIVGL